MFNKSKDLFPTSENGIFLSHCAVSPLYSGALKKGQEVLELQQRNVAGLIKIYNETLESLRVSAAGLMKTSAENLAFVNNTSEGISMIANGYPLQEGDEIITYVHEYPANYYPWRLQEQRGAKFLLLPDRDPTGRIPDHLPSGWSLRDLEKMVTDRTRIIALSHVQFTSGYAADLKEIGSFCHDRGIDLIIDAAQSLGSLPVYPEENHISAVVSSGWKWLMGPLGTGLMFTAKEFRARLKNVMVGAELMVQGTDYLDHSWQPHATAKRFEYSTSSLSQAASLNACLRDLFLIYPAENIFQELIRLQELFIKHLDQDRFVPLVFPSRSRSGILALICTRDKPGEIQKALLEKNVLCTERGGYLRVAPHYYNTDEEIRKAADVFNGI